MNALGILRKQPLINRAVRTVLLSCRRFILTLEQQVFLRWRVSGVISLKIEDTPFRLYSACDDFTVDELYYGYYSENTELKLFVHFAREASCILDVGANVGLYSVLSGAANPDAQVIAFEPHPTNVSRIKKNIGVNNLKNVHIIGKAVGAEDKAIELTVPDDMRITRIASTDSSFSRQFHSDELTYTTIEVDCTTLDSYIANYQPADVELVKIDVENFEMEVFKGASSLFESFAPIVFCEIHMNEEREGFFTAFLEKYDYQMYALLNNALFEVDDLSERYGVRNYLLAKRGKRPKFYPVRADNMSDFVNTFRQGLQNN